MLRKIRHETFFWNSNSSENYLYWDLRVDLKKQKTWKGERDEKNTFRWILFSSIRTSFVLPTKQYLVTDNSSQKYHYGLLCLGYHSVERNHYQCFFLQQLCCFSAGCLGKLEMPFGAFEMGNQTHYIVVYVWENNEKWDGWKNNSGLIYITLINMLHHTN